MFKYPETTLLIYWWCFQISLKLKTNGASMFAEYNTSHTWFWKHYDHILY